MHDVVIIGSGPAGLTAAIYTARANLSPVMYEGAQAGGQLTLTTDVENYPGFPTGIMGPQLIQDMHAQAERFGTTFHAADVTKVDLSRRPFTLTINDEETIQAKSIIISTGASANLLGLDSESRLLGHGVSTCATCDGFFFRGKPIAVIGGGDSALEEATFLTKFASHVTVIHRRDTLRASKIMQDKAMKNDKVSFRWNSIVEEVIGDGVVSGLRLRDTTNNQIDNLDCKGVFVAIGHTPNTQIFKGQIDTDANGYIQTTRGTTTNVPGVFAAGDVQDSHYRQAITAAGTGCMAALDAEHFLEAED
jgi:thioredoxin reductase (NADPH)